MNPIVKQIIYQKGEYEMSGAGKKMKISITGDLGSGKSTVCRYLKENYGLNVYSIGQIQRSLAQRYNMDVLAFNRYMESHPEIDEEIDTELTEIGKRDESMVLDSRMAWHFVPDSFKVYLSVDPEEAARRVINDQRGKVETYKSREDAMNCLIERKRSENIRYSAKYGVQCSDPANYDLIIDTTLITPEQAAERIMAATGQ
jgi:cytidylate kinase